MEDQSNQDKPMTYEDLNNLISTVVHQNIQHFVDNNLLPIIREAIRKEQPEASEPTINEVNVDFVNVKSSKESVEKLSEIASKLVEKHQNSIIIRNLRKQGITDEDEVINPHKGKNNYMG